MIGFKLYLLTQSLEGPGCYFGKLEKIESGFNPYPTLPTFFTSFPPTLAPRPSSSLRSPAVNSSSPGETPRSDDRSSLLLAKPPFAASPAAYCRRYCCRQFRSAAYWRSPSLLRYSSLRSDGSKWTNHRRQFVPPSFLQFRRPFFFLPATKSAGSSFPVSISFCFFGSRV